MKEFLRPNERIDQSWPIGKRSIFLIRFKMSEFLISFGRSSGRCVEAIFARCYKTYVNIGFCTRFRNKRLFL